jgi:Domain of unknown function (DUF4259)
LGFELIDSTLDTVLLVKADEYLHDSPALEAIVAAEAIARLQGNFGTRNACSRSVDKWVAKCGLVPSRELSQKAHRVLDRILTGPTDLLETWCRQEDRDSWIREIDALKTRIRLWSSEASSLSASLRRFYSDSHKGDYVMSEINQTFLKELRVDIDTALDKVAKKHRITLKTGHCTFNPSAGNFSFKVEGVGKGGVNKHAALYISLQKLRPNLPPLHTLFTYNGKPHEIVGSNTTGTKVIAECGDKRFQFPVDAVERLCAEQPADKPKKRP